VFRGPCLLSGLIFKPLSCLQSNSMTQRSDQLAALRHCDIMRSDCIDVHLRNHNKKRAVSVGRSILIKAECDVLTFINVVVSLMWTLQQPADRVGCTGTIFRKLTIILRYRIRNAEQ
jgi:hypothetical protein